MIRPITTAHDAPQLTQAPGAKDGQSPQRTPQKPSMNEPESKMELASPKGITAEEVEARLVGKTFGSFIVIGPAERRMKRAWAILCRCHTCGRELLWPVSSLENHGNCNCARTIATRENRQKMNQRHPLEKIIHQWVRGKAV